MVTQTLKQVKTTKDTTFLVSSHQKVIQSTKTAVGTSLT